MREGVNRRNLVGAAACVVASGGVADAQSTYDVRHHGVAIRVPDLDAALAFFGDGMGFAIADIRGREGWARLASNVPIYIEAAPNGRATRPREAHVEITFQSNNLEVSMPVLRSAGARILTETPQDVAVGRSIRFVDPMGVLHHMLQASRAAPAFAEPRVYNTGFEVPQSAIAGARAVLERGLGFVPMTERYFPPSVPYLEQDHSFAFMLHHNQPFEPDHTERLDPKPDDIGPVQIFVTRDLNETANAARAHGATPLTSGSRRFPLGRRLTLVTPGGAPFELWQWG